MDESWGQHLGLDVSVVAVDRVNWIDGLPATVAGGDGANADADADASAVTFEVHQGNAEVRAVQGLARTAKGKTLA